MFLDTDRDYFVYEQLSLRLCLSYVLLMALPQIEQQSERHRPDLILGKMKLGEAVIKEPGKQLFVRYPTTAFFESPSLSTFLFVPLYIASVKVKRG
ncbi:MAG: hypothetical protein II784_03600 [Oscillospiraceae bacterium]|nr:hypothetical protein [Oscillospiraceae bacterium]